MLKHRRFLEGVISKTILFFSKYPSQIETQLFFSQTNTCPPPTISNGCYFIKAVMVAKSTIVIDPYSIYSLYNYIQIPTKPCDNYVLNHAGYQCPSSCDTGWYLTVCTFRIPQMTLLWKLSHETWSGLFFLLMQLTKHEQIGLLVLTTITWHYNVLVLTHLSLVHSPWAFCGIVSALSIAILIY